MSTGVDRIQPAELEVQAGSSVVGLSTLGPAELTVSAGSSSAAVPTGEAAEVQVSGGPVGNGAGFVMPTLSQWKIIGHNVDIGESTLTVVTPTTTAGDPCMVQFEARVGVAVAVTLTISTPEQNTPHTAMGTTRNASYMGQTADLWWRWWSGLESGGWALVGYNVVTIPGFNDPDIPSEG